MRSAASQLDEIKSQTLNSLARYASMNQDLAGGFNGLAYAASMKTTEEIATTGRHVSARFEQVINAMQTGANEYDRVEHENQAKMSGLANA